MEVTEGIQVGRDMVIVAFWVDASVCYVDDRLESYRGAINSVSTMSSAQD